MSPSRSAVLVFLFFVPTLAPAQQPVTKRTQSTTAGQGQAVPNSHTLVGPKAPALAAPALSPATPTSANLTSSPIRFEENLGQSDPSVRFIARGAGYTLFLTPQEAVFLLSTSEKTPFSAHTRDRRKLRPFQPSAHALAVRMKLLGANALSQISGTGKLPGVSNYFLGRNKDHWHIRVPNYASATYSSVYPGIDMVYYGNQRQLEYDFNVQPGADPSLIKFSFSGVTETALASNGDLQMKNGQRTLVLHKPSIYQMENGIRKPISGGYSLNPDRTIGVQVSSYDHAKNLVIDPVLQYSTYVGGSGFEYADTLALDPQGNSYIIGSTTSPDFPATGTIGDPAVSSVAVPFITKLDPTGTTLIYSDYFGGSGQDSANGMAVDANGYAYVVGSTTSSDFPITNSAFQSTLSNGATNVFLAQFSADGSSLLYSTYLGGALDDEAMSVAVDSNQNAYLTGYATSSGSNPYPTTAPTAFQPSLNGQIGNAFLTRIDTTQSGANSLIYSTYLGGANSQPFGDVGYGIALDSASRAYIAGETTSTDFPVTTTLPQSSVNPNGSVFASIIDTTQSGSASLIYSTYLAGTGAMGESGNDIALDPNLKMYLTGYTTSPNFPVTTSLVPCPGNYGGVFVSKLDPTQSGASTLVYSTCVGSASGAGDQAFRITVDPNGAAYYAGIAGSSDFPITSDALQPAYSTYGSGFLSILNPSGTGLLYSTYLGGSGGSEAFSVVLDSNLNIYVDGDTSSTDLQGTSGEFQPSLAGENNAFISKFSGFATPFISSVSSNPAMPGTQIIIGGGNFGASQGASSITFNGIPAVASLWSASSIAVTVPNGATSGPLTITVDGAQASTSFQVPSFYLESISPSLAGTGSTVTLAGADFGSSQGSGSATINGQPIFVFSWSDGQIIGAVQQNTTSGPAQVSQGAATSNTVNFIVAAPNLTTISPTAGAAGTQVTFSGSGFGASQGTGNVLLGTAFAAIVSWSDAQIVATVVPGSSSGTAQVLQGGIASNPVSFTVSGSGPTISSVSPSTALAGTQVTVTGSGFGASQGASKILLGTTFGSVVSWSDGQIVATVPLGSSSGNAEVFEGLATSNTVPFNVVTPTITSISPTSGPAGTQVTISGSGFGTSQGNGNAWLGTAYGLVVSWSDSQVVATVASGSGSGYAQILQNGVWSNSLALSTGTPNITSISPSSGAAGTQITISGSGFGSSAGTLQLGTEPGAVSSWTDSQIIATVASGSMTGIVEVQQNGLTSNALRFVVPTQGNGNAVTLSPSLLNLLVGQTQTVQALSPTGTEVTGLTWTSSDSTVVSLSTDDPPVLTALAPGHITITAGDSSSDVTVSSGYSLPVGTVVWSAPGDGSGVTSIIPAVPSPTGVADTFAVQADGNVQAITSDGSVAWTANVGSGYSSINADFLGGLVVASPTTITKYDGITGQQASQYTYSNPSSPYFGGPVYFGTDGTIFTIDGGNVVGIDPSTGATKFSVAMQQGTYSSVQACEGSGSSSGNTPPSVGASTLAGDGYLYVAYEYTNSFNQDIPQCQGSVGTQTSTEVLMRVGPTGDNTSATLGSFTNSGQTLYYIEPNLQYFVDTDSQSGNLPQITSMMTNADQGILATWSTPATSAYCSQQTFIIVPFTPNDNPTLSGCVPSLPGQSGLLTFGASGLSQTTSTDSFGPMLQDANGIFYGGTNEGSLSAFNQSGNVLWSVPGFTPVALLENGAVLGSSGSGQYVTFSSTGTATGQLSGLPAFSWVGNGYLENGSVQHVDFPQPALLGSFAALQAGNASQNGTPVQQQWYPPLPSCRDTTLVPAIPCPGPRESMVSALRALRSLLASPCLTCAAFVFQPLGSIEDQFPFSKFLNNNPGLYDAKHSNIPLSQLCDWGTWSGFLCGLFNRQTLSQFINSYPSAAAVTLYRPLSPLKVFFNPSQVCPGLSSQRSGFFNQARLFHEALHGFYGDSDMTIQQAFGLPQNSGTTNITFYIDQNVLGQPASSTLCAN
jgi:IPT/TIG domain/Beta-propeller repeat